MRFPMSGILKTKEYDVILCKSHATEKDYRTNMTIKNMMAQY